MSGDLVKDDLIERINAACVGHPHAKIPWPHRLLHECRDRIKALERECAALRGELTQCRKEKNALVLKAYPAMDQRDDFEKAMVAAFGLLWRDVNAGPLSIEARKVLSALLTKEQKAAGINEALGRYGDPHEGDVLAAVDRAFPPEYVRAEAQAAHQKARAEASESREARLRDALEDIARGDVARADLIATAALKETQHG